MVVRGAHGSHGQTFPRAALASHCCDAGRHSLSCSTIVVGAWCKRGALRSYTGSGHYSLLLQAGLSPGLAHISSAHAQASTPHARRPTSGRYAFRTLATCTRATVVTRADAGSRQSHCCGTHHAASPGIDQSSRNMLSLHKGRGGSQAVYRYSGLATLMRAGQLAPLLWHQPKRSHYCGAAR